MITDSAAGHLARVRLAADGDELRQRLIEETRLRVSETLRRERAEQLAEELSAMAADSEASARSAAGSVEQLQARLSQVLLELSEAQDNVATEQKKHAASRESMSAEVAMARRTLAAVQADGATAESAHARALELANDERELTLTIAETEKLRYEEEMQLLLDMLGMHMDAAAWNAKREGRVERVVLEKWYKGSRRFAAYRKSAKRLRKRVITQGFSKLKAPWANTEANAKVFKALAALRMRKRRAAMSSWAAFAAARKAKLHGAQKGLTALRHRGMRSGFNSWAELAHIASEFRRRMGSAAREWRGTGLRKAWFLMLERFRQTAIMIAAVKSIQHRSMRAALNQMYESTSEAKVKQQKIGGVLKSINPATRGLRLGLNTFKEAGEQLRHLRRAAAGVLHRNKLKALNAWIDEHLSRAAQLQALRRGGAALRNQGFRRAFVAWLETAQEASEQQRRLRSAAAELRGTGLRKFWFAFLQRFHETAIMLAAVKSIRHRSMRLALNQMRDSASQARTQQQKMGGAIKAMDPKTRNLRLAYNNLKEAGHLRRKLKHAASGILHGNKRKALNAWRSLAESRGQQMMALRRGGAALRNQGFRRAFVAWLETAQEASEQQRRLRSAAAELRGTGLRKFWFAFLARFHETAIMLAAVKSIRHRSLRLALNQMYESTREAKAKHQKIGGVLKSLDPETRMMRQAHNSLKAGGAQWRRLRRAGRGIKNRRFLQAFNSWKDGLEQQRRRAQSLKLGGGAFLKKEKRKANNTWAAMSRAAIEHQRRLKSAMNEWRGGSKRKVWHEWLLLFALHRRMLGAINSLLFRKMRLGYNTWRRTAAELTGWEKQVSGAITIFDPMWRMVRFSVNAWKAASDELRRLRACVSHFLARSMRKAFRSWLEEARERLEESRKRPAQFNRAIAAIRHKGLFACFKVWEEMWEQKRKVLGIAKNLLQGGGYRKAWASWLALVDENAALRSKLAVFSNPGLFKAWSSWAEQAAEYAEVKRRLLVAGKDMLHGGGYRKAWAVWILAANAVKRAKGAVRALFNGKLAAALNSWRAATVSRHTIALKMLESTREGEANGLKRAWVLWQTLRVRAMFEATMPMRTPMWFRPAFDMWVMHVKTKIRALILPLLGVQHAFERWLDGAGSKGKDRYERRYHSKLRRIDRDRMANRGQWMLRELRHAGTRGISSVWRHSLMGGWPRLARAWVAWKANATREAVARNAAKRRRTKRLAAGLNKIRTDAFLHRLRDSVEKVQEGRKARLKVAKVELISAEEHSKQLTKALENAQHKSRSRMRSLEAERDAALDAERKAIEMAKAERAAALRLLNWKEPEVQKPSKPRWTTVDVDRWSTAASRGHAKVSHEEYNETITQQRMAALKHTADTPREGHSRKMLKKFGSAALLSAQGARAVQKMRSLSPEHRPTTPEGSSPLELE